MSMISAGCWRWTAMSVLPAASADVPPSGFLRRECGKPPDPQLAKAPASRKVGSFCTFRRMLRSFHKTNPIQKGAHTRTLHGEHLNPAAKKPRTESSCHPVAAKHPKIVDTRPRADSPLGTDRLSRRCVLKAETSIAWRTRHTPKLFWSRRIGRIGQSGRRSDHFPFLLLQQGNHAT